MLAEHKPIAGGAAGELNQGTIDSMRVRSGMIGNTLGFGVRRPVGDVAFTAYIQIWAFVESEAREKNRPNPADIRQGYAKVEGKWGSVLAGRSRALFSRGATDIDVLYGHRYGVGFPGNIDSNGPALGSDRLRRSRQRIRGRDRLRHATPGRLSVDRRRLRSDPVAGGVAAHQMRAPRGRG